MSQIRALWQTWPNQDVNTLNLDRRLPSASSYMSADRELAPDDAAFLLALRDIPGVVEVALRDYQVRIVKGVVFDWDEIREPVERAVAARFGAEFVGGVPAVRDEFPPKAAADDRA